MKFGYWLLLFSLASAAQAQSTVERLNKNGVALCDDRDSKKDGDCYDPVSYFTTSKAEKAGEQNSQQFRASYQGITYVFASEDHRKLFQKNPELYLPQFGGWCAYAVAAKKEKVDIDPKSFHIQDGKLLLFYDGFLADTRKTWLHDKDKNPGNYLQDANNNWPQVKNKEP